MSFEATWPALASIWLVLLLEAAACSGSRSLVASAHTAALGPAAGLAVLEVVGVDAVVPWVTAGDAVVLVVWDFDELPQAATDRTTINANSNAMSRYRT